MYRNTDTHAINVLVGTPKRTWVRQSRFTPSTSTSSNASVLVQSETSHPKESVQGVEAQESEQANNTIITRDSGIEESNAIQPPLFGRFASSEPAHEIDVMVKRWLALEPIVVTTTQGPGTLLASYMLPEFLYTHFRDLIALNPFTTYAYSELAFQMKFVVNANKFHCGRLVASYRNDAYAYETPHNHPASALTRPHVLLDLATNVEGVLNIPFQFHRAFIRNVVGDATVDGTRCGYSTLVSLHVLSSLRSGDGAPNEINVRPYIKISNAKFYGMAYRIEFQMDTIRSIVDAVAPPPLRHVLRGIEVIHDTIGQNYDKPSDYTATTVVPSPTLGLSWGKGPQLACPLKLSPSAMTTNLDSPADGPSSTLDIARIWGCRATATWSASHTPGAILFDMPIDPVVRSSGQMYSGFPTPLEVVCGMYNFWSGTIEMRFDFISNAFHTGAVMICAEFGRPGREISQWKSALSSYTKTFHLGEQKSVSFVVPYIYDTTWRRSNVPPFDNAIELQEAVVDRTSLPMHMTYQPTARVRMYVINELRPPQTTTQTIDVLVFWRATSEFRVHSLCQSSLIPRGNAPTLSYPSNRTVKVADTALRANVKAVGMQTWADIVNNLGAGQAPAAIPSTSAPLRPPINTKVERPRQERLRVRATEGDAPSEDIHEVKEQEIVVDPRNYLSNKTLPHTDDYLIDSGLQHSTRNLCEVFVGHTGLIRDRQYVDKYTKIQFYDVWRVKDPFDYTKDEHIGYIRFADHTPRTQMEYDSHDPTHNFNLGLPALRIQTTDDQTSIKDILRRPVMIYEGATLAPTWDLQGYVGFWIPVTSVNFFATPECVNDAERLSSGYVPGLSATPHSILTSMFRFWRGSSRFTILVHDGDPEPIYITYVPHSGVHLFGNIKNAADLRGAPIYGGALGTHVVVPSINPMATIEVPFDTMNQWCLTNVGVLTTSALPRDKTDCNAGHLVLSALTKTRRVSLWWSAGDDYELSNYYGVMHLLQHSEQRSVAEKQLMPETQMDTFRNLKTGAKEIPNLTKKAGIAIENVDMVVGRMQQEVSNTVSDVRDLTETASNVLNKMDVNIDRVSGSVESLTHTTQQKVEQLSEQAQSMMAAIQSQLQSMLTGSQLFVSAGQQVLCIIKDLVLDISMAIIHKSWLNLAVGIIRSITTIVGASVDTVLSYAKSLESWFMFNCGTSAVVQIETDQMGSLAGIVVSLVGVLLGTSIRSPSKYEKMFDGCAETFTSAGGITYINGVIRLVEKIFSCTQEVIKDCLSYCDPEARALRILCSNSKEVDLFVKEAQRYTLEVNTTLLGNPRFREKIWALVIQAHMFQSKLISCPLNKPMAGLARMCKQVIDFANENHIDLTSSPLRFEPFCFAMYGEAGIGKSHCTAQLCSTLLKKVGYKIQGADVIYTRSPGMDFWDGFNNQPVILYDDFGNMTGANHLSQQVSELYQLKTTAPFTANMASLNDKGMRGTPLMIVLNTNEDFPNQITNVCSATEAVYRRRDELIKVHLKEGFDKRMLVTANPEMFRNYEHLQFSFHSNPAQRDAPYETRKYDWPEFVEELGNRFETYHRAKMTTLKMKMKQQISDVLGQYPSDTISDPYLAFWDLNTLMQNGSDGELPSDTIQTAVEEAMRCLQTLTDTNVEMEDDGVTTQGIGLISAITGFTLAALTSEPAMAMVSKIMKTLNSWIWSKGTNWHPVRECCRCGIKRQCTLGCVGVEKHFFCYECSQVCGEHCAFCRASLKGQVTPAGKGVLAHVAQYVTRVTASACMSASALAEMWANDAHRMFTTLTRVSMFLNLLSPVYRGASLTYGGAQLLFSILPGKGDPHYYRPRANSLPRRAVLAFGRQTEPQYDAISDPQPGPSGLQTPLARITPVDSDDDIGSGCGDTVAETLVTEVQSEGEAFFDASDVEIQAERELLREKLPVYNIRVEEDKIRDFISKPVNNTRPCMHEHLVDMVEFIRYAGGSFHFLDHKDEETIIIPMRPCKNGPCIFRDFDVFCQFLETYVRVHKDAIKRYLAYFYNERCSIDTVLHAIPELLIPEWVRNALPPPALHKFAWWEKLKGFVGKYKKLFTFSALAATALGGLAAIWKMWPGGNAVQSNIYDVATAKHLRRTGRQINIVRGNQTRTQSEAMVDQTMTKIVRNQILIRVLIGKEHGKSMLAQGIYGHIAIMPKHYIRHLKQLAECGCEITIEPSQYYVKGVNHLRHSYTFDINDFGEHEQTDLAYFRLPNSYPLFKDIRGLFWTDADIQGKPLCATADIVAGPTTLRSFVRIAEVEILRFKPTLEARDENGEKVVNRDVLEYNYSEKGACGSFIISRHSTRPILAMHTAGAGSGTGYGTLITRELLDKFLPAEPCTQSEELDLMPLSEEAFIIDDLEVALDYIGELPKGERPHVPSKSKIRPSAIHGMGKLVPQTRPAFLHKDEVGYAHPRSPLYYGVRKHGLRTKDFPSSLVSRVGAALYDGWFAAMRPVLVPCRRLTVEQAICGFEMIPFYAPMKLTTSAGYPWTQKGRGTTKSAWINVVRDEHNRITDCEIDPLLVEEIARKEELRRKGVVPATIFVDTLKDERRNPEKAAKAGGTRVFCSSPVDFTIAMRQNLLPFCAAMMQNRHSVMSAVGINPKGTEWTKICMDLSAHGQQNIFQLDYSNFGPGFNAVVAKEASRIIKDWTMANVEGVVEAELDALLLECTQSLHVAGGTVYRQFCGSPSGASITTIINSVVNLLYVMTAWALIVEANKLPMIDIWATFRENVCIFVYGDDLIGSVSEKYKTYFNAESISCILSNYGIVATDSGEVKVEAQPLRHIYEAEFLKRGFKPHPTRSGYVLAPLRWASVNDATQWVWSSPNLKDSTLVNCEAALMEAHGHGPAKFAEFKKEINDCLRRRKITPTTLEWAVLDNLWFEEGLPDISDGLRVGDDNLVSVGAEIQVQSATKIDDIVSSATSQELSKAQGVVPARSSASTKDAIYMANGNIYGKGGQKDKNIPLIDINKHYIKSLGEINYTNINQQKRFGGISG